MSHKWIKIEITQVHVVDTPQDLEPTVILDPEGSSTQYGCEHCDVQLNSETLHTICAQSAVDIQHPGT